MDVIAASPLPTASLVWQPQPRSWAVPALGQGAHGAPPGIVMASATGGTSPGAGTARPVVPAETFPATSTAHTRYEYVAPFVSPVMRCWRVPALAGDTAAPPVHAGAVVPSACATT